MFIFIVISECANGAIGDIGRVRRREIITVGPVNHIGQQNFKG